MATNSALSSWCDVAAIFKWTDILPDFFSSGYLPHRYCYLAQPGLVWTNAVTDGLIGVSYCVIFTCLMLVASHLSRIPEMKRFLWIVFSFGAFVLACAGTHLMDVVTIWWPIYPIATAVKVLCALVSVPTALYFARTAPSIAPGIRAFLTSLSEAVKARRDNLANYKGKIEAIEASHMVIEFAMDGTIERANENYLRRFGYREEELVGQSQDMVVPDEYRQSKRQQEFWTKLRSGRFDSGQYERIGKLGGAFWVEGLYNPITDAQGKPVRVMGILSDMTQEIKTRNELHDAEARLRVILDSVLVGILMIDGKGKVISINPAAVNMFEYPPRDVVGQNVRILMPEPDSSNHDGHLANYQPTGESRVIGLGRELMGRTKTGRTFPIELTVTEAAFNGERSFIGLVRDLTERRETEKTLRESSENEQLLILGVKDYAVLMLDVNGYILTWNEGAERTQGYNADEIIGQHFSKFYPPDAIAAGKPAAELVIAREQGKFEEEGWRVKKDGSVFWANVAITALYDRTGALRGFGKVTRDMSERKRAEEQRDRQERELRKSEEVLDRTGRMAMVGGWDVELVNQAVHWTDETTRLLGFEAGYQPTLEEAIGLYAPEHRDAVAHAIEQATIDGQPWELEAQLIRADGSLIWALIKASVEMKDGKPVRMFGAFQDVTARRLVDQALRESEANFANLVNLVPQFVWICTNDGMNTYFNQRWYDYTGLTAEQSRGAGWSTPFHPEESVAAWEVWNRASAAGKAFGFESRLRGDDGNYRWFLVRGEPARDAAGCILRWFGTFTDIHEMKREEAVMRGGLEQFQAMVNGIPQLAWMAEADGSIFWYNERWYEYTGTTYSEMEGWRWQSVHDPAVLPQVMERWTKAIAEGKLFEMEFPLRGADGKFLIFLTRVLPLKDSDGHIVRWFGTNTDINERKRAEQLSARAQAEAEVANRAKSEFLANMSHEIRTPMNAIMGMTHLALRANPTPDQKIYLKKIGTAADSLLSIINDILDFSKMEAGKMELEKIPFSVENVLLNLNDMVNHAAKRKNIAISFSIGKEVPPLLIGDPLRLGQILINLVNNGIKFTREGSVVVTVSATKVTNETAEMTFTIADSGIGMTEEQLTKLFKSFNQADPSVTRKFGGTGLGLAISKQLSSLMGGTIDAASDEGKGSTFTLRAPFDIASGSLEIVEREEKPESNRHAILVVDDSEDARDVLVAMLTANGFDSKAISSGEEVLAVLSQALTDGQPFDLILMDWRLPGKNGLEIARKLREMPEFLHFPSIIMVSAFEREQVMHGVIDPGLEGFLVKPVKESVLIQTIRVLLRARGKAKDNRAPSRMFSHYNTQPDDLAGRHVLLVEDNEINRDLATELLADLGIKVSVAVDGREGVDRIASESFDLVLMDIQMPVMDGLTATRLIRSDARFDALPIIAMTAHAMTGDRENSLAAGMNDHLTKPISPDGLTGLLLRWMPKKAQQTVAAETNVAAPPSEDTLPEELAPFDLKAALARTNGKPKLLRKMMLGFRKQYTTSAADLRLLTTEGNFKEAQRLAHSLKSVARLLEAGELGDAAESIELAFRAGNEQDLQAQVLSLIDLMEQLLTPAIAAAATLDRRIQATETVPAHSGKAGGCVLIVDDDPNYLELLTDIFRNEHEVLSASNGMDGIRLATQEVPDVILLDVMMPDIDGYEVCARLKSEPRTCDIPLIFLTGLGDVADESRALAMGAVDYVTKPINPLAVRARVDHQIQLKRAHDRLMQHATKDLLARLRKEAERAEETERISRNELELRDHFLSHVSHELRSPLTAIYMFSTLIADGLAGATTPQQDEYLTIIQKNIGQLKSMIEDLLLVTAAKTGKLEVHQQAASLMTAIVDAIQTVRGPSQLKGVQFSSSVGDNLEAYADPVRLLQVLIILCDNAIKFTPAGGAVKVEAHRFESDPSLLLVEVSDTGRGIQPEMTERIFEHLYQISDVNDAGRNGLGLGLHIARELVTRQGGKIWAEALPTGGSRFSFTVPVLQKQLDSTLETISDKKS